MYQTQRADADNFVADSDAKTTKDTLVRVSDDERMVIFEFDGVLIARESFRFDIVLVRKVDQLTFEIVVTAAFQTSGSLRHRLFFGERARNDFAEVILSFFRTKLRQGLSAESFSVFEGLFGNIVSFNDIRFFIFYFFAREISVDHVGCLARVSDGFDRDGNLIVTAVAAREYARHAGHEGFRIVSDRVLSGLVAVKDGSVYGLSDRKDHGVDRQCFGLALHRNRFSSAGGIRFAEFHHL